MLRGGRSWPSERKLGTGALSAGKTVALSSCGATTVGGLLSIGVTEQNAVHRLQLSGEEELPSS
jgi:hypothetical protein